MRWPVCNATKLNRSIALVGLGVVVGKSVCSCCCYARLLFTGWIATSVYHTQVS